MISSPSSSVVVVCTYVLRTPAHFRVRNVGGGGGDFDTFQGRMNMEGGTKIGWPQTQTLPTDDEAAALHCSSGQRQQRSERIPICLYGTAAPLLSSPFATDGECTAAAPRRSMASAAPSVRPSPSRRRHAPTPPRPRRAGDTRRAARSVMASPSTRVASAARRRSVRARACAVSPIATVLFRRRGGRADRLLFGRGCLKSRSLARLLPEWRERIIDRPTDRQKERERGWRTNKRADFPLPSSFSPSTSSSPFHRPRQ